MDLTYGILGLGKGEEADLLWEDAAEYCQRMAVSGLAAPYQSGYMYLGGQLKFYVFDTPGVSYLPFIRSSEMVLIEAEANYFLNNEPDAQAALIELNATSGRNPEYTCTKTGEALWNEIMDYRELELWGEGFAWSDYKRWNRSVVRKGFADGGNAHISIAKTINEPSIFLGFSQSSAKPEDTLPCNPHFNSYPAQPSTPYQRSCTSLIFTT